MFKRGLRAIAAVIVWGLIAWGLLNTTGLVRAADPERVVRELLQDLRYAGPAPAITWVDAHQVVEACNCRPPAFYRDNTAYLSRALDLDDVDDRSILLHELVHHVQTMRRGPADDCHEWVRRELEATALQRAWLLERGGRRFPIFLGVCK